MYKKKYNNINKYINDRNKLKEILSKNGKLFRFLPYHLRNDEELCIIACSSTNGEACKYASKELLNNKEFAKRTIGKYIPVYLTYFSDNIKDDLEICEKELYHYYLFSERLRKDKNLALKAVKHNWSNIYSVDNEIREDEEFYEELIALYWKGYKEEAIEIMECFRYDMLDNWCR